MEELADSSEVNLPLALDVKVLRLPVLVSIAPTLVRVLDVNEFNEPVEVSNKPNLVF
jgi:hypothetical protein